MAKNGNTLETEIAKKEEELKSLLAKKKAQDDKLHLLIGKNIKAKMAQEPSFNGQIMDILDRTVTNKREREQLGLGEKVNVPETNQL